MGASLETEAFRRSPTLSVLGVLGAVAGVLGASRAHPWLLYAGGAVLAVAAVDFFWQRRNPLITLTASDMVIRLAVLSRVHRLAYSEVAGWAHSGRALVFETLQSKRIFVPLHQLKKIDRMRLVERLSSLNVGQPGFDGVTKRDIERRERRRLAIMAAVILATFVGIYWFVLRESGTSPDNYYAAQPRCAEDPVDTDFGHRCFALPEARAYLDATRRSR